MNRSLKDIGGGLLLVPQFTLTADTRRGMCPSLTPAADPGAGERLRLSRRELAWNRYNPTPIRHDDMLALARNPETQLLQCTHRIKVIDAGQLGHD